MFICLCALAKVVTEANFAPENNKMFLKKLCYKLCETGYQQTAKGT